MSDDTSGDKQAPPVSPLRAVFHDEAGAPNDHFDEEEDKEELVETDPALWPRILTQNEREKIIRKGPPSIPLTQKVFHRDSKRRAFPKDIFDQTLPNGEKCARDYLVWSPVTKALYCFPCWVSIRSELFFIGGMVVLETIGGKLSIV